MITLPIKQMAFDVFFSFLRRTWNFFSEKNIGWVCSHVNLIKISKNQRIRSLKNKRSICFNLSFCVSKLLYFILVWWVLGVFATFETSFVRICSYTKHIYIHLFMPSISRVLSKGYPTHKKERLSDKTGMG